MATTGSVYDLSQSEVRSRRRANRNPPSNALIDDICGDDPFNGIGKPEMLRANLSGLWSRRITDEHRLVYFVQGDDLVLVTARYHYDRT